LVFNDAVPLSETEQHPWLWYAPPGATCLIIGTFPPTTRNWSFDFFYPNIRNLFWRIIAQISNGHTLRHYHGPEAVAERKMLLGGLKVAITDMGHVIRRTRNNSLDENLEIVLHMDIFRILDENPGISRIILTSSSGPVSALRWFKQYLIQKGIQLPIRPGPKPLHNTIEYNGRIIRIAVLHSPSLRAANRISFEALCSMYAAEILTD
jgi:G:T/U-mismatch repair DNA glycosylase